MKILILLNDLNTWTFSVPSWSEHRPDRDPEDLQSKGLIKVGQEMQGAHYSYLLDEADM